MLPAVLYIITRTLVKSKMYVWHKNLKTYLDNGYLLCNSLAESSFLYIFRCEFHSVFLLELDVWHQYQDHVRMTLNMRIRLSNRPIRSRLNISKIFSYYENVQYLREVVNMIKWLRLHQWLLTRTWHICSTWLISCVRIVHTCSTMLLNDPFGSFLTLKSISSTVSTRFCTWGLVVPCIPFTIY